MAVKTLAQIGTGLSANAASIASTLGGTFTTAHVTAIGHALTAIGQNCQDISQMVVREASLTDQAQLSA